MSNFPFTSARFARLRRQYRPVVLRLAILLGGFCLLILVMEGWNLWASRRTQLDEAAVNTSNMARALAAQGESALKVGDAILSELVERVEHDGAAGERLRARLVQIVHDNPEAHGLFIYGPQGEWLATSLPDATVSGNNSDREYFRYHAAHADRTIHIGKPIRSRSSGVLIIPLSRRIERPDGSFGGVALVTVAVSFFGHFYDRFDIGPTGMILLATEDGTLIYRRPFHESMVGMSVAGGAVFQLMRRMGPVGTGMMTAKIDGIERLYSYRHLDGFPLVVACAMSRDELLADWHAAAWTTGCSVLIAVALLAWGGARMLGQVRVRERLERQLRYASRSLLRQNLKLRNLAEVDGLTGLANRRVFDATLAHEVERARRTGAPLSLLLADVDFFKRYNDSHGHVAGDECLRRVAAVFKAGSRRPPDVAARYGGEEFALILPETDLAGARAVAEKLRAAVAAVGIAHDGSPLGTATISIGVVTDLPATSGLGDPQDWVEAADQQLYAAKAGGRNRVAARTNVIPAQAGTQVCKRGA